MSDCLWPHESQHTRPPCPSQTPGVHSDSHPSSQWCHPAISSSVVPFSSCPQSLPASVFSNESTLRMRWPKYWSFSFSISPSKEHPGLVSFRMDWLVGSPCSPRDSQESSPTPQFKSINSLALSLLLRWGKSRNSERLFSRAPKSLQTVAAAMKLKDAYSLEEKLWPT